MINEVHAMVLVPASSLLSGFGWKFLVIREGFIRHIFKENKVI
jgi:hypothetical protein